jgi:hypothetical protein
MVGFGIIIAIVAIIILIFVGFMINKPEKENIESYEVESYIQSILQYTTECRNNLEYITVQKLIFDCIDNEKCLDGKDTCDVLENTIKGITKESWKVEGGSLIKGYVFEITNNKRNLTVIQDGNLTGNSKGSMQDFSRSGNIVEIRFNAYY